MSEWGSMPQAMKQKPVEEVKPTILESVKDLFKPAVQGTFLETPARAVWNLVKPKAGEAAENISQKNKPGAEKYIEHVVKSDTITGGAKKKMWDAMNKKE
ncbi:MAG: hypothetical protein ABIH99_05515 [Candidatus Micrarchaeota archaeon]